MKNVSIIVPFHSNKRLLDICLSTLTATTPDEVEIIVVLNNADSRQIDFDIKHPRIRIEREHANLGYSKAINLGVKIAKGNLLVFCDSDTFLRKYWLESLHKLHNSSRKIGLTSCKLIDPNSDRVIDYGMGLTKYNNAHPFKDRRIDHPLTCVDRRVQMACSACMMMSRDVFECVGGMDTELYNFYQDTDLCLRVNEAGLECWIAADAMAYHRGDSAQTNRSPYRADVKGWYVAKNAHRMAVDMEKYYQESYRFLAGRTDLDNRYLWVDLSSVADRDWHREVVGQILPIITSCEVPAKDRDEKAIELITQLDGGLLETQNPIIYFVDRFIALQGNALWKRLRRHSGDIVVDRNANIEMLNLVDQS